MADNKLQLDPGFEEVQDDKNQLDDGFQEMPVETKSVPEVLGKKLEETGQAVADTAKAAGSSLLQDANDLSAGLVQGATLDFADEAQGAVQGGTDYVKQMLTGDNAKTFMELYRKRQQDAEAQYKRAEERSPWLYGSGQLAGALGTGILSAGSGLALGAGKIGLREALKKGGIKALAGELGLRTGAAGVAGGIQGAGASEGGLESEAQRNKLAADVTGGAAMGATLGLGGSLLGGAAEAGGAKLAQRGEKFGSKVGEYVEDSPLLRQARIAYNKGLAGEAINEGEEAVNRISREQLSAQKDITNQFINTEKNFGRQISDLINVASDAGAKVPVGDLVRETADNLGDVLSRNQTFIGSSEAKRLMGQLAKLKNQELDPRAAQTLRREILDLADRTKIPELQAVAYRFQKGIKEAMDESIPGLKDVTKQFREFRSAGSESLLSKGQPTEFADAYIGDLKNPALALSKEVTETLGSYTAPGSGRAATRRSVTQTLDNLRAFDKANPGALQRMGFGSVDEFAKKLTDKSDEFAITRQILGYDPQSSPISNIKGAPLGGAKSGRGYIIGSANLAGRVAKGASNKIPDLGKNLYAAPENALRSLADELDGQGLGSLGAALRKGLDQKNQSLKNAALFSIMQNPKARLFISGEDVE